jgi:molybdate transport system substrate-binding protein
VVGSLPDEIQSLTTFSGGMARTSSQPEAAKRLLDFLADPALADIKRRYLMDVPAGR